MGKMTSVNIHCVYVSTGNVWMYVCRYVSMSTFIVRTLVRRYVASIQTAIGYAIPMYICPF